MCDSNNLVSSPPEIEFKVKSIPAGYLVKFKCGREIVFQTKYSLITTLNAYIENPLTIEEQFKI